jgi:hypothetical protein
MPRPRGSLALVLLAVAALVLCMHRRYGVPGALRVLAALVAVRCVQLHPDAFWRGVHARLGRGTDASV